MAKRKPVGIVFPPRKTMEVPFFGHFLAKPFYAGERVFNRLRGKIHWCPSLIGQFAVAIRTTAGTEDDDGHFLTQIQ